MLKFNRPQLVSLATVICLSASVFAVFAGVKEHPLIDPPDSALVFDGKTTSIEIEHGKAMDLREGGTVEAWIRMSGPGDSRWPRVISNSDTPGPDGGWQLILEDRKWLRLTMSRRTRYTLTNPLEQARWHHVAVSFDGKQVRFYVDGRKAHTIPETLDALPPADDSPVRIGDISGKSSRKFEGMIAEVRLWDRARRPEQIRQFFDRRLEGNEEGLVAYWPINEGSGEKVADLAGEHDGRILGKVRWQPER